MKKRIKIITVVAFAIIIGIFVTFNIFKNSKERIIASHALYMLFPTIDELAKESDYIIIGTVSGGKTFKVNLKDFYVSKDLVRNQKDKFQTYSESKIKLDKILKGNINSSEIEVLQEIDDVDGKNNAEIVEKPYELNKKYIFFLKYFEPKTEAEIKYYKNPKFIPTNAIQGAFEINSNKVDLDNKILLYKTEVDSSKKGIFEKLYKNKSYSLDEVEKVILNSNIK